MRRLEEDGVTRLQVESPDVERVPVGLDLRQLDGKIAGERSTAAPPASGTTRSRCSTPFCSGTLCRRPRSSSRRGSSDHACLVVTVRTDVLLRSDMSRRSMCGMTGACAGSRWWSAAERFETPAQPRLDTRCGTRRVCQDEPHAYRPQSLRGDLHQAYLAVRCFCRSAEGQRL